MVLDTSSLGMEMTHVICLKSSEFEAFVERAERELWQLFETIDHDKNGHLDKTELQTAFSRAGMAVPKWKVEQFFAELDKNHDGVISFQEFRYGPLHPLLNFEHYLN